MLEHGIRPQDASRLVQHGIGYPQIPQQFLLDLTVFRRKAHQLLHDNLPAVHVVIGDDPEVGRDEEHEDKSARPVHQIDDNIHENQKASESHGHIKIPRDLSLQIHVISVHENLPLYPYGQRMFFCPDALSTALFHNRRRTARRAFPGSCSADNTYFRPYLLPVLLRGLCSMHQRRLPERPRFPAMLTGGQYVGIISHTGAALKRAGNGVKSRPLQDPGSCPGRAGGISSCPRQTAHEKTAAMVSHDGSSLPDVSDYSSVYGSIAR